KDEQRCIARCIDSATSFVSRVVVLDTGSTDRTAEIASGRGAQVHHFQWCDDFSAARNRALELADADWNLVLDADEWLSAGGEWLRVLGP
ncbi:glycosyltransferase, partial [Streptococcus suis]|uniref:glycosyltransferase n=3 Tax=Bacteria TaxID=2 RepID=UPI00370A0CDF